MKLLQSTAALVFVSLPMFAHGQRTGVSNPEPVEITAQPDQVVQPKAKPSAAIPETAPVLTPRQAGTAPGTAAGRTATSSEIYGAYVPYKGAVTPAKTTAQAVVADPDAEIVTTEIDRPGELREGTLLRARIRQKLSTVTTEPGTEFTAELTEPVEKDGRVVLPMGAMVEGRVTEVHGGKRISGQAVMHLEPKRVVLPDGTRYTIHAQLIDTSESSHSSVDREGTLVRRDHPKETLATIGLAAGGAAAGGAVIAGGVGAAVGAGIGAGAGTILWLKQDRQATLPQDSLLIFSLTSPMPLMPTPAGNPVSEMRKPMANADGAVVGDLR